MSRRLLAFLLSELKTVRVKCPHPRCGAVTELEVEQLGQRFADRIVTCPVCGQAFPGIGAPPGGHPNAFVRLADAIMEIQRATQPGTPGVEIEFVLPDPAAD